MPLIDRTAHDALTSRFRWNDLPTGARNLFDEYPGKARLDFDDNFNVFPWAAASPLGYNGRFRYVRLMWTTAK
jgi:hypothetical protein